MKVDFGLTAADYGRHRVGFPAALFERLEAFGVGRAGQDIVDIGTGTGALARAFAARGCRVVGVDVSEAMLAEARRLAAAAGLDVRFVAAPAEATTLPPQSADVVTAGQCWHWFDRPRAGAECRRLLRPGGTLVIASFDWLPLTGNLADATEQLIREHNPAWTLGGGPGLYPDWLTDVAEAGFGSIESFSTDVPVTYTPERWRGRIRASAGIGASLSADRVAAFDAELATLLATRFPGEELSILHRVFAIVVRAPA